MAKTFQDYFGVVDLETLGVASDAPILSLGLTFGRYDTAKSFDELISTGLYTKFDLKEQIERGRKPADRVVKWWYDQDHAARRVLIPTANDVSLYGIKSIMTDFFNSHNIDIRKVDMYDRNCFDMSKLQYLVEEDLGTDVFWSYNNVFDIPTALRYQGFDRYAGMYAKDIPGCIYHNALHDAALDQLRLYKMLHHE